MSRRKKSDTATIDTTDWSFTELPGLMDLLETKIRYVAREWEQDPEDLMQEAVLALAVRPDAVAQRYESGGISYVVNFALLIVRDRARTADSQAARYESLDALLEGGDGDLSGQGAAAQHG